LAGHWFCRKRLEPEVAPQADDALRGLPAVFRGGHGETRRGSIEQTAVAEAPVRLAAEEIRDAILQISGRLDPALYGEPVRCGRLPTGNLWKTNRATLRIAAAFTCWLVRVHRIPSCLPSTSPPWTREICRCAFARSARAIARSDDNPLVMESAKLCGETRERRRRRNRQPAAPRL